MSKDTLAARERDQEALQGASQKLLDIRNEIVDVVERRQKVAIATGDDDVAAECSRRVDKLAADEREYTARVEALGVRAQRSRAAHADDELPGLLTGGKGHVGDFMDALGALSRVVDGYLAARRVCQQCLRESTTHKGSIVGVYPRPSGGTIADQVLRLFEDMHGQPHG